jgi:hypothetical protein
VSSAKFALPAALLLLAGCTQTGEIDTSSGVGITALRSPCPHVGVPAGTGDITTFDPADSRDASAIDITATLTNVTAACDNGADQVNTAVTFDVFARRANANGPRDVTLPYFVTVVRGGSSVVAKSVGHVTLHFDAGQLRAQTQATASATVDRAAATLPEDVRARLNKKRKAGEEDAAMDPLADPSIRQSVLSATFEALVGFQLTEDQLKYNVTR